VVSAHGLWGVLVSARLGSLTGAKADPNAATILDTYTGDIHLD
jgi:hypothetical protein